MDFIKHTYKAGKVIRLEIYYKHEDTLHIALLSKYQHQEDWYWLKTKIANTSYANGFEIVEKTVKQGPSNQSRIEEFELQAFEMLEHPATQMALWFH